MANMMLGKTDVRPQGNRPRDGRHCDLCGCSQPAVRCDKCGCQIFCLSCDDMYHRHPKRRFHLRKAVDPGPPTPLARPVLPVKAAHSSPGDPSKMPLPPPRKKKPAGKSFFDTFRRRSPSAENSPPLPKKEYSWTDRLGNIKKFMSNRPLPPLPDTNGHDISEFQPSPQPAKHDMSFIHKRVEERPPQLPQRSLKPDNFPRDKENLSDRPSVNNVANMRNGTLDPSMMNRRFSGGEDNWENRMPPHMNTLNRQAPPQGYFPQGGPGYPGNMHQSSSATDLPNLEGYPGMPPHYPHYPMPPFPYPMYPPQAFPQQYFGSSFANLSSQPVTTTDGDFSDQSDASAHRGKRFAFRKRAKRSQSVMMDRMAYPGQYFPFGPYPPGYPPGPWGAAPYPMEAPPSPASSVRSLNRLGRTRRRKKAAATSDDDEDEEPSLSSSPLSRPKSSSSERPPPQRRPPPPSSSSGEEEEESEEERRRSRSEKPTRRGSDPPKQPLRKNSDPKRMPSPVPKSPLLQSKKIPKQKMKEIVRHSDSEEVSSPTKLERQPSRESNADQGDTDRPSAPFTPSGQWQCLHCTFINAGGSRICQVCCKTATADTVALVGGSRPPSSAEQSCPPSPEKRAEERKENQDMAVLNSALDEAEEEINRGLQELMKLKEDFLPSKPPSKEPSPAKPAEPSSEPSTKPKPVYKSSGKMRTSILDKLNLTTAKSTSTETQTAGPSKMDRVIEARRPSTSSTTSDAYNSPTAQSPLLMEPSSSTKSISNKKESSCQTQTDDLMGYVDRKTKVDEDSFFMRGSNGYDRRDGMQSPRRDGMQSPMFDRGFGGGGFGMMQRSHSRASLFTGRMNDLAGPLEYGLGATPMYRSVSRSSLTGDYTDNRFSEFHNLRKPDYYLSMEELVERRRQESIRAQGLELVRMIREAEQQGFSADDIQVALSNCGPQNPLEWLQENWRGMVEGVVGLSASYARDKREDDVGTVSEAEAREALRLHKGHVWAAVTECVESRQRKFLELKARGKFKNKDITDALSSSQGDVEAAYAKLTKSSSKPFLMRIWGAGEGVANQDPAPLTSDAYGRHQSQYYSKDAINDDVLSDEAWDEEEVDWEEDSEDDEEQGDLEDLRTCHEDLSEVKTPESDSEYDDAFGSNTLERNKSAPSSDFIPEVKQEKKVGGFLSKLAALRKEDRGKKSTFYGSDVDVSSLEDEVIKEEETKTGGPLSVIKNTISAIRESVSGVKGEKKSSSATLEKRTIIVGGQIAQGEKGGVTLVSAKALKDEEDWKKDVEAEESNGPVSKEGETSKKVTNESKSGDIVDTKQKEAARSFNAGPSTSGYVPPNKQQDKSSPVQNPSAVDKTAQKKTEGELSSHKKGISSGAKSDTVNSIPHTSEEKRVLNSSSPQKNSPSSTTSVKSDEVSSKTKETVRTSSLKQIDKVVSDHSLDETRKVKFQITDEKRMTADDKLYTSKTSDSQNLTANISNTTEGSESTKSEKPSNSIKITKKDADVVGSNSKTQNNASEHQEEKPSPLKTFNSKSDFQISQNVQKERTDDITPGTTHNSESNLESTEQISSDSKEQAVVDKNFQKEKETRENNTHNITSEKPDHISQNEEGYTKFPPVTSVVKVTDSAQAIKENAITVISSVQIEDNGMIDSDSLNVGSKNKESSSLQDNFIALKNSLENEDKASSKRKDFSKKDSSTSEITPTELAVKSVLTSKTEEIPPESNTSSSSSEKLIKDSRENANKQERKDPPATTTIEHPSNKASNSASTVSDEKPKTISEKKPTSVKPKFKLVKLNKNEPEKRNETETKKSTPSTSKASTSSKIDLGGEKNALSPSPENIPDVTSPNSLSPTTEKEIYPPDIVEKIKMIPISSELSPQKTDSQSSPSVESNINTAPSSEALTLPTESNQKSINESQQSDSSSSESKEIQKSEALNDNKMELNSENSSISDTPLTLKTATSSTEFITPELNTAETTSDLKVEPPSALSPKMPQITTSASTELNQQMLISVPTDPNTPKTSVASPDPVQQFPAAPSPEPAQKSSKTESPESVQQSSTSLSPEPVQKSVTTVSPEPGKQSTTTPSPKPVQQSSTTASPEPVEQPPTTKTPTQASPSLSPEPVQQSTSTPSPKQDHPSTSADSSEQFTSTSTAKTEQHSKEDEPQLNEGTPAKSSVQSDVPNTPEDTTLSSEPATENATSEDEEGSSNDSRGNSMSPPNPIDTLRNRFEGLMDPSNNSTGTVRPQSPFRRMSFRSTKAIIALERTRDSSVEKPWFLPKPVPETKKAAPRRSIKQQLEMERRMRKMVSDRKCRTYRKAEIVVQLMDMNFEEEEALQAANDCSTLEQAISYLQQECLLCTGNFPVSHIISMVHCPHKACRECLRAYFTVQIRDRNIMELLCPFCNEPDIFDEDVAQDYFNHLDIMLKKLVDPEIHELFQRKLRDRVLMRDPNFKWCSQCSSGFIAMPNLKRLVCPDCNAVTCASCRRPWEREHQGISCEAFAAWKDAVDPEAQTLSLAKLLTEEGIDCPRCHFKYQLAKGGCMHFRCTQCQHDFCSGCYKPFKMGQKCGVSEFCAKLGLHAHHPRNCLFYLRDKEPEDLQRLLDLSGVKYDKEQNEEQDGKNTCQVMEQKETADGMLDDYCGKDVEQGFAGLCRLHYVEYLGQLVNKHKVDPTQIFENDDLELVLRRANIRLPPKRYREADDQYKEKLIKLIQEKLPLDKVEGS